MLLALAALAGGLILPARPRAAMRDLVRWLEERLRLAAMLLWALLAYWVVRIIVLDPSQWYL
jgi:hypothetical protein